MAKEVFSYIWFILPWIFNVVIAQNPPPGNSQQQPMDYCVGPLVHSNHRNPIQERDERFANCALACEYGNALYGLSDTEQGIIDANTIIGTVLCLIGLIILSINLYYDTKTSKEKFLKKPLLFHIPYMITLSTFAITLIMAISLIIGKETVICYKNTEYTTWNPGYGESVSCTVFGVLFYYFLLAYIFYVLLLSFVVWRQFINPLNPLWGIKSMWWHGGVFLLILIAIITGLAGSSIDAIEPMGVCLPGTSTTLTFILSNAIAINAYTKQSENDRSSRCCTIIWIYSISNVIELYIKCTLFDLECYFG